MSREAELSLSSCEPSGFGLDACETGMACAVRVEVLGRIARTVCDTASHCPTVQGCREQPPLWFSRCSDLFFWIFQAKPLGNGRALLGRGRAAHPTCVSTTRGVGGCV